jgi:hypothetical protein
VLQRSHGRQVGRGHARSKGDYAWAIGKFEELRPLRVRVRGEHSASFKRSERVFFGTQRWCRDEGAAANLAAQIAVVDEALVGASNGLWSYLECACEASNGWQPVAWPKGPRLHAAAQLVDELLAQGILAPNGAIKGEIHAGAIVRLSHLNSTYAVGERTDHFGVWDLGLKRRYGRGLNGHQQATGGLGVGQYQLLGGSDALGPVHE